MQVRLENVTKKFPGVTAVNTFSVTLPDGELICLLGPSGCGKSTILNMLSGILPVSGGSIYFDEDVVNANDATALTSADARARDGSVRIGTRECISSAPDSLLGYNVCYCYQEKDGDNILVAMKKKGNREQELGLYMSGAKRQEVLL